MLPNFQPMPVGRSPRPFSHPDWIYEIKWDGFRSLAYLEHGHCKLISRNGNEFKSFAALNLALPLDCGAQVAVLDGEIVCLDKTGTSQFTNLLFRRGEPRYYAFDLPFCNGEDLRSRFGVGAPRMHVQNQRCHSNELTKFRCAGALPGARVLQRATAATARAGHCRKR